MNTDLLTVLITLLFSAFFSGVEIAYLSSNKLKIELGNRQGILSAKILTILMKSPSHFIGTVLVGNNVSLVIYGIAMARLLKPFLAPVFHSPFGLLAAQTVVATLLVLVTAEFIPKALFRINPNKILSHLAIPIFIFYLLFSPVVYFIIMISRLILKTFFKLEISATNPEFGRTDLNQYLRDYIEKTKVKEIETEIRLFHNALSFSERRIRNCMVILSNVVSLEVEETIETLRNRFIETGYSRILVFEKMADNIIGYIHSFELFKSPDSIRSILLPLPSFSESKPAKEALAHLIRDRRSIATVKNEMGKTSGIVTVEDIIEEIFGEIEDEHDM